ncbi:MAG: lipopolysaccharide biosynthesis protein [Prevotellaceae bacterium]|jgi:O-antigen/teichoic acid export membrane protein|nr:lipopolysaccharide biosynthesis protein [Prevotellaceae bacterium]
MANNLKKQTATSIVWSIIDKFGFQIVAFATGIVTARLLSPDDFGLIGALAIFTILSNVLVESGFTAVLVRRQTNTDADYSAAFIFNILLSIILYIGLVATLPAIARYFRMPELTDLGAFLFVAIIINSLGIIQTIKLTKDLKFKELSIANLTSAVVSAIVTVLLAWRGYAYWAIAWQQVLQAAVRVAVMWILSDWAPRAKPNFGVIKELFAFSAILMLTSVINTLVKYIYHLIIGRYYRKEDLGYYYQANKFQQIPSTIVSGALSGVAYPVLSKLNDDKPRQLLYFRKLMRINAFLIFPIMFGLVGTAENFIEIFLSAKWLPTVPYLQILAFAAVFAPFQSLCLQTLITIGQPRWNFRLEMLRNAMIILSIFVCAVSVSITCEPAWRIDVQFFQGTLSIQRLLIGFVCASFLAYVGDVVAAGHFIGYRLTDHLKDILPYMAIAAAMYGLLYGCTRLGLGIHLTFVVQLATGIGFYLAATWGLGSQVLRDVIGLLRGETFD